MVMDTIDIVVKRINEMESRRMVLDYLVDKIYVFDDEIMITLFYTDDKRTLEFHLFYRIGRNY